MTTMLEALPATAATRDLLRDAFDDRPLLDVDGRKFVLNPLTEQSPATSPTLLRDAARRALAAVDLAGVGKIVGEEDKGGVLVAAVALLSGLPFGMARWMPSGLADQVAAEFVCEYASGKLYLNGVDPGDRVVIVDDLISTGGTLVALIEAVRRAGAEIADVVCVAEKVGYGGVERVRSATGCRIKTIVKIDVSGARSKVVEVVDSFGSP